jgi:uncharacterized protein (DUF697 family)
METIEVDKVDSFCSITDLGLIEATRSIVFCHWIIRVNGIVIRTWTTSWEEAMAQVREVILNDKTLEFPDSFPQSFSENIKIL